MSIPHKGAIHFRHGVTMFGVPISSAMLLTSTKALQAPKNRACCFPMQNSQASRVHLMCGSPKIPHGSGQDPTRARTGNTWCTPSPLPVIPPQLTLSPSSHPYSTEEYKCSTVACLATAGGCSNTRRQGRISSGKIRLGEDLWPKKLHWPWT